MPECGFVHRVAIPLLPQQGDGLQDVGTEPALLPGQRGGQGRSHMAPWGVCGTPKIFKFFEIFEIFLK
jgi:hypothetical protein